MILFLTLGCAGQASPPMTDLAEVDAGVTEALNLFARATRSGDLEEVGRFYCSEDDGGVLWLEEGAVAYPSREVLLESLRGVAQYGTVDTSFSSQSVLPIGANHAWLSTAFATTIGDPTSGDGFGFAGVMTVLMSWVDTEDGEGRWCALRGHTSTPSDPQPESGTDERYPAPAS